MATATEPASYCDVVVTSTSHWREGHWHVGGRGIAVACEERDELRRWDVEAVDTHGVGVIPLLMGTSGCGRTTASGPYQSREPQQLHDPAKVVQAQTLQRWRRS